MMLDNPELAESVRVKECRDFREHKEVRIHESASRFLGTCSLVRMNWRVRCFEIGYWLRTSASGHGYMTEAVSGITEFARDYLDANRIEIRCDTRNLASRGVAERSGYHLEAILRRNFLDPVGQLQDDCLYAKIRLDDGTMGYPAD